MAAKKAAQQMPKKVVFSYPHLAVARDSVTDIYMIGTFTKSSKVFVPGSPSFEQEGKVFVSDQVTIRFETFIDVAGWDEPLSLHTNTLNLSNKEEADILEHPIYTTISKKGKKNINRHVANIVKFQQAESLGFPLPVGLVSEFVMNPSEVDAEGHIVPVDVQSERHKANASVMQQSYEESLRGLYERGIHMLEAKAAKYHAKATNAEEDEGEGEEAESVAVLFDSREGVLPNADAVAGALDFSMDDDNTAANYAEILDQEWKIFSNVIALLQDN